MLKSPEPKLGQNAEELDAGWEEAVAPPPAPPRPSGVSVTPVAVATDELDDAWGELPAEPLLALRRAEPETKAPATRPGLAAAPLGERSVAQSAPVAPRTESRVAPSAPVGARTEPRVAASAPVAARTESRVAPSAPVAPRTEARVAPSAPVARAEAPAVGRPTRTLSKKQRRELERKQRVQAKRTGSQRKQSARAERREQARRLAEQRQEERRAALAAAKERARDEKRSEPRATPKPRAKPAATEQRAERAVPKSGTKREASAASRTKGRPKKYSGGGYIIALIALITLATGLYAWSKR